MRQNETCLDNKKMNNKKNKMKIKYSFHTNVHMFPKIFSNFFNFRKKMLLFKIFTYIYFN